MLGRQETGVFILELVSGEGRAERHCSTSELESPGSERQWPARWVGSEAELSRD